MTRTEISSGSFIGWAETRTGASELAEGATHGGSDLYVVYFFCEKILGEADEETIDIYEARKYKENYIDQKN